MGNKSGKAVTPSEGEAEVVAGGSVEQPETSADAKQPTREESAARVTGDARDTGDTQGGEADRIEDEKATVPPRAKKAGSVDNLMAEVGLDRVDTGGPELASSTSTRASGNGSTPPMKAMDSQQSITAMADQLGIVDEAAELSPAADVSGGAGQSADPLSSGSPHPAGTRGGVPPSELSRVPGSTNSITRLADEVGIDTGSDAEDSRAPAMATPPRGGGRVHQLHSEGGASASNSSLDGLLKETGLADAGSPENPFKDPSQDLGVVLEGKPPLTSELTSGFDADRYRESNAGVGASTGVMGSGAGFVVMPPAQMSGPVDGGAAHLEGVVGESRHGSVVSSVMTAADEEMMADIVVDD